MRRQPRRRLRLIVLVVAWHLDCGCRDHIWFGRGELHGCQLLAVVRRILLRLLLLPVVAVSLRASRVRPVVSMHV